MGKWRACVTEVELNLSADVSQSAAFSTILTYTIRTSFCLNNGALQNNPASIQSLALPTSHRDKIYSSQDIKHYGSRVFSQLKSLPPLAFYRRWRRGGGWRKRINQPCLSWRRSLISEGPITRWVWFLHVRWCLQNFKKAVNCMKMFILFCPSGGSKQPDQWRWVLWCRGGRSGPTRQNRRAGVSLKSYIHLIKIWNGITKVLSF